MTTLLLCEPCLLCRSQIHILAAASLPDACVVPSPHPTCAPLPPSLLRTQALLQQQPQQRRSAVECLDAVPGQPVHQAVRVPAQVFGDDDEAVAVEQLDELLDGGVEGQRRIEGDARARGVARSGSPAPRRRGTRPRAARRRAPRAAGAAPCGSRPFFRRPCGHRPHAGQRLRAPRLLARRPFAGRLRA